MFYLVNFKCVSGSKSQVVTQKSRGISNRVGRVRGNRGKVARVKITEVTRSVDSITNELIGGKTTPGNGNYIRGGRCGGGSCKKWAT
jgi:hypothetical protein